MANNIVNIITAKGKQIIAAALMESVTFTSVVVGAGCYTGNDITTYAYTQGKMQWQANNSNKIGDGVITAKSVKNGVFTLTVSWSNDNYTGSATKINQIGVYAKTSSTFTTPVLFGYLSFGDYGTGISAKGVQSITRTYDIPYSIGSSSTTLQIVPSGYVSNDNTASTAQPNKLIYSNSDGKLPVSITGDAQTLSGHSHTYFAIAGHSHSDATSSASGFMSAADKSALATLNGRVGQSLNATSSPTFAGLTVNGYIDGAQFR